MEVITEILKLILSSLIAVVALFILATIALFVISFTILSKNGRRILTTLTSTTIRVLRTFLRALLSWASRRGFVSFAAKVVSATLLLLLFATIVIGVKWLDLDEIIKIASSMLALLIFTVSAIAYLRERRRKLLLVSAAFFFYALKGFLKVSDVFIPQKGDTIDIAANLLDFVILLLFFFAIVVKESR